MMRRFARFMESRSKVFLSITGILLATLVGWIDFATGSEISVSLVYLVPVVLTAWFFGRKIFLYTDGVTEARNLSGELFGENRLMEILARNRSHSPDQIKRSVLEAVDEFSQGDAGDDLALLCIVVNGQVKGTDSGALQTWQRRLTTVNNPWGGVEWLSLEVEHLPGLHEAPGSEHA